MGVEEIRAEVEAAGKRHYAAAGVSDEQAIDELLADDVAYTHSNGLREGKDGYMERIVNKQYEGWNIE